MGWVLCTLLHLDVSTSKQRLSDAAEAGEPVIYGVYKDMIWFFAAFLGLISPANADPCTVPSDCGIATATIPDFTLTDVNPNSPTFGTELSRGDVLGQVMVIYFSSAT